MFNTPSSREPLGSSGRDNRAQEREIAQLQADVERLLLITEALWKLLREKTDLADEDLTQAITKLDLEDGLVDFRKKPTPPRKCPKCQRVLTKRRAQCMVCGAAVAMEPFER